MDGHIFISYRREDSRGAAGRIYDRLELHFGHDRIFMDVDTIQPGMDFIDAIENAVSKTDVFLVVIGPNWVTATDRAGQKRLDNPEDFVRLEVGSALKRNVWVIPVLVNGAMIPRSDELPDNLKPLTRRNALEISHTRFNIDTERLIRAIEQAFEQIEAEHEETENKSGNISKRTPEKEIEELPPEPARQVPKPTPVTPQPQPQPKPTPQAQPRPQYPKPIPATPNRKKTKSSNTKLWLIIGAVLFLCVCCPSISFLLQLLDPTLYGY
jgi:hypothetical protein